MKIVVPGRKKPLARNRFLIAFVESVTPVAVLIKLGGIGNVALELAP
jgi:hypothetical protein